MNTAKGVEYRKLTEGDLQVIPECFKNEKDGYASAMQIMNWCMIHKKGDSNPYFAFRNMNVDSPRWCGIIRTGDTPFGFQTSAHHKDVAQADAKSKKYEKVSSNPVTFETSCDDPYFLMRYGTENAVWKEGNFLDLKFDYLPNAIISHYDALHPFYVGQMYTYKGTYEGEEVTGFGGLDRVFRPTTYEADWVKRWFYVSSGFGAIRADGKRILIQASIYGENGKGLGVYFADGEEPIVTDEVWLDCDWERLPYATDEDTTCGYRSAVWRFGGKEIHFNGKWGSKGFTETPRMEKVGQSQCFGEWYDASRPEEVYDDFSFIENSDCKEEILNEYGFKVM